MKRKIFIPILIVILFSTMLLSSCFGNGEYTFKFDYDIAKERTAKLFEALENKDKDALKAMFSKNSLTEAENFDESVEELFDYFQGNIISYEDQVPTSRESIRSGKK